MESMSYEKYLDILISTVYKRKIHALNYYEKQAWAMTYKGFKFMPEIMFAGPEGRLEGRYSHSPIPNAPLALILHPNPEHGGTMNNKISYMMFQAMNTSTI